jgi:diaminopimelate epimerase
MRFSKYHGTGNDFVMIEDVGDRFVVEPWFVAAVCARGLGIGADGIIRIAPSRSADFFMDYWNADGNVAEMCGNGIRCLVKYVYDRGLTTKTELDVDTRGGLKHVSVEAEGGVAVRMTVDMGTPSFVRKTLPMVGDPFDTFVGQLLDVSGRTFRATALSMGNPHCVLFLESDDDLAEIDVPGLGTLVEHRPEFPARTNVEFVRIAEGRVDARVWERGSGETMACGTGACAALVASSLAGLVGRKAEVRFPGGLLVVDWRTDDHVWLTGPAVHVFEGDLSTEWLEQAEREGQRPAGAATSYEASHP